MFIQIVKVTSKETEKNLANISMEGWNIETARNEQGLPAGRDVGGLQGVAARTIARGKRKIGGKREGGGGRKEAC